MSKRGRGASQVKKDEDDGESSDVPLAEPVLKKKKKMDPIEICSAIYEVIRNHKKEDGNLLCESFIRMPKKRQDPAYHEVVSNPIDLQRIQQKIKTDEYETVDDMAADVNLLVTNIKSFFKKNTQEFKDIGELNELFHATKMKLTNQDEAAPDSPPKGKIILKVGKLARKAAAAEARKHQQTAEGEDITTADDAASEGSSSNVDEDTSHLEELFAAVMQATDADGRCLSDAFLLLPSRKKYPQYYDVIETPLDLKAVARKIQAGQYASLNECEKDLLLVMKNACQFNEPGSQIYKDAKMLKKVILTRKYDILRGKPTRTVTGSGTSPLGSGATTGNSSTTSMFGGKRKRGGSVGGSCGSSSGKGGTNAGSGFSEVVAAAATATSLSDNDEGDDADIPPPSDHDDQETCDDPDEEPDNPLWQLFNTVNTTCGTGAGGGNSTVPLSEPFKKLPSKRFYADYYKEIQNPVSLMQIRKKLLKGEYGTVSEVAGDLNVMFENAKKYNRQDSKLYKDAVKLQKIMQSKVKELLEIGSDVGSSLAPPAAPPAPTESETGSDSDDGPLLKHTVATPKTPVATTGKKPGIAKKTGGKRESKEEVLRKRLNVIFKTLTDYSYEDGRQPGLMFMEKPSKKLYPEYYKKLSAGNSRRNSSEVITEPIDLLQIQASIRENKYTSEDQLMTDVRLMFSNCKRFNEENSVIYKDAVALEKVLMEKLKDLGDGTANKRSSSGVSGSGAAGGGSTKKSYKPRPKAINIEPKLKALFDKVREFRDDKGRQLSQVFNRLPSRTDLPDYYEIIKRPIDMEKIGARLRNGGYEGLEDLTADLMLMLDNACKFNEPDSSIYKSALQLQRVVLQTKRLLSEEDSSNHVPDVQAAVQDLLAGLFTSVYNHQDEEGRCFSDSMQELPEHDLNEADGKRVRGISLEIVKRRLDKGLYKRLDRFQEDLFACLERARKLSRTDSQVFEDSIELQAFYIRQRDEMCRNGEILSSPAFNYNLLHLSSDVEQLKLQKTPQETFAEDEAAAAAIQPSTSSVDKKENKDGGTEEAAGAMVYNQEQYHVGDFVYVEPKEKNQEPVIIYILRGWTNNDNVQMLFGDVFFRPDETYHAPTRKFLEQEVFKSDKQMAVPLCDVLGRCCVLSVKDYFKMKPQGFEDKDVYVCESRYSTRARCFKKIKIWPFSQDRLTLIARDEPLEPKRVMSYYLERLERHKTEMIELEELEKLEEKEYPNVQLMNMPQSTDNKTHYQQINLSWGLIKTGDFVYVETENKMRLIAQIDTIFSKDGEYFINGPWFLRPQEILFMPGRLFFKQEIFQGCLEDSHPISSVVGRCYVMEHADYISCRPTEIDEKDIFVCTQIYNEQRRQLSKLTNGLPRYTHNENVRQDEIYYFRRVYTPIRVTAEALALQMADAAAKTTEHANVGQSLIITSPDDSVLSILQDDSMDGVGGTGGSVSSGGGGDAIVAANSPLPSTLTSSSLSSSTGSSGLGGKQGGGGGSGGGTGTGGKKGKDTKSQVKLVTGYILYSSEVRKGVSTLHPEANFGEVSRLVGNEWRQLPNEVKQAWEEKAARMNEDTKEAKAQEELLFPQGQPLISNPPNLPAGHLFECLWDRCDYQFEDLQDCVEHTVNEATGHVITHYAATAVAVAKASAQNSSQNPAPMFQCKWLNCNRVKKGLPPFPSLIRLNKHVKEVHVMRLNGRVVPQHERTKNFIPSRRPQTARANAVSSLFPLIQQQSTIPQMNQRPAEPLFLNPPQRIQRVVHSETYIKYIEGLTTDSRYISHWDRMLRASQEAAAAAASGNSITVDESRLPGHWLAHGQGNFGSITNALWALRDFMFRDALNISKVV